MEGIVVNLGQRAGRSQQLNHDPPPETSYSVSGACTAAGRPGPGVDPPRGEAGRPFSRSAYLGADGWCSALHFGQSEHRVGLDPSAGITGA
jgi:hypothetical protein